MKYTVTIKDNESGEIVREVECNSLVAGASFDDERAVSLCVSHCNGAELLCACKSAKKAIYKVLEDNPAMRILFTLFEMELVSKEREKLREDNKGKEDAENA